MAIFWIFQRPSVHTFGDRLKISDILRRWKPFPGSFNTSNITLLWIRKSTSNFSRITSIPHFHISNFCAIFWAIFWKFWGINVKIRIIWNAVPVWHKWFLQSKKRLKPVCFFFKEVTFLDNYGQVSYKTMGNLCWIMDLKRFVFMFVFATKALLAPPSPSPWILSGTHRVKLCSRTKILFLHKLHNHLSSHTKWWIVEIILG